MYAVAGAAVTDIAFFCRVESDVSCHVYGCSHDDDDLHSGGDGHWASWRSSTRRNVATVLVRRKLQNEQRGDQSVQDV